MHVLVTGGGGFLGRWIVEKCLERGDRVRIFSRAAYPELEARGVEGVRGDLRDFPAVMNACRDVDTVFHVAALAGLWGKREAFFSINVDGTSNVIRGCRENGVPRLVYTSSPSVVFGMGDLAGVDESTPYPDHFPAYYPASKAQAEQLVLAANGHDGLNTCSLRPHLIWGPRDHHIIQLLIDRARARRLIRIGDGTNRVDLTYVENAAEAHLLAAAALGTGAPPAGRAYFISDAQPVNLWTWIADFLEQAGLPLVQRHLSYPAAYLLGALMEAAWTVLPLRGEPLLTRFVAAQFAKSHYFDGARAAADFGYRPRISNEEGLARTLRWLRDEGKTEP